MTGLTAYSQLNENESAFDIADATGPIAKIVSENVTVKVINGMANNFIVSGMYFLYRFSNHAAKATAQITGITELV